MQEYAQQKLSCSSFEGGYISAIPVRFHYELLNVTRPKSCVGEVLLRVCPHSCGEKQSWSDYIPRVISNASSSGD
jgi:hypothetical protein